MIYYFALLGLPSCCPRGFGWDAFVVVGWVDQRTASLDQSNLPCPLVCEVEQEEEVTDKKDENLIYRLRRPEKLVSKYQEFLANKSQNEVVGENNQDQDLETNNTEIFHGWVYVETENLSFFVEPTTGTVMYYILHFSPELHIWNKH